MFELNICVQVLSVPDVCVQEVCLADVLDISGLWGKLMCGMCLNDMSVLDMFLSQISVYNMSLCRMPQSGRSVKRMFLLDMSV